MSQFYRVQKILAKRVTARNESFYKIQWQGFPESQSTWEPISNLKHVSKMVQDFEAQQEAQTKSMSKLRPRLKEQTTSIEPPKRTLSRVYKNEKQTEIPCTRQFGKKMSKKQSDLISNKKQDSGRKQQSITRKQVIENVGKSDQSKHKSLSVPAKNESQSSYMEIIDTQSIEAKQDNNSDVLVLKDISLDKENRLIYLAERRGLRFYLSEESVKKDHQLSLLTFLQNKLSQKLKT